MNTVNGIRAALATAGIKAPARARKAELLVRLQPVEAPSTGEEPVAAEPTVELRQIAAAPP